jgi:thiol-disulfide isomerase/thioredoxin
MYRNPHNILRLTALLWVCASCRSQEGNTISGRLDHAGSMQITFARVTGQGEVVLDSTITDDKGSFSMTNAADRPDYYVLRTGPDNIAYLILDGTENIVVNGDARNLESTYSVTGSEDSRLLRALRSMERDLTDSLNKRYSTWRESNPASADSIGHVLEGFYTDNMNRFAVEMIRNHPGSLASLSATKFLDQSDDLPVMTLLADSLKKRFSGNPYVDDYALLVKDLQRLPPGSLAPELSLLTPEGKKINLSSFKGRVVLVDFWASWCGPCRRANPDLVRLYAKHKGKGFEILGVSLDEESTAWKAAIEKDGLAWPQGSELKKWESSFVKSYSIEAIPYSVLLDEAGRIVAKGLQPEELEPALEKLLRKTR